MPPRSTNDRDEHSVRRECWDDSSTDLKTAAAAVAATVTATPEAEPVAPEPADVVVVAAKSVRFAPTAKVRQITKMSKDQSKDIWYCNEDFARMKKSFAPTVQRMMNGTLTPVEGKGEDHCIRGLEYRTKEGARKRMKNKFNGMAAVLHEQDRQIFEEMNDPEQLRNIYREVNAKCLEEAIALGTQDALDVKDYLSSDNTSESSSSGSDTEGAEVSPATGIKAVGSFRSKRTKLRTQGSFQERSIRGLKRIFSGKSKRRNEAGTVVAAA